MPSVVTSIIGGIQGASAAHNAAAAQRQGYANAANTVNTAVGNADPYISNSAATAASGVSTASGNAGAQATNASAGAAAGANAAASWGNGILNPWVANGTTASDNLAAAGQFSFNPSDLENTPGYQFTKQQGDQGIQQSAAAAGLLGSGSTMRALDAYNTNLASTTYNQQYQNALQAYQTNANVLQNQANTGLAAGNLQSQNLMTAAQYGGNANLNAAEYAGTTGMQGAEYAGNAGMAAGDQIAQNLINAGVYTGNTQIGEGNATAQGDIGAANSWNSMLGGIGSTLNSVAAMGFGAGGGFGGGMPSVPNYAPGISSGNYSGVNTWNPDGSLTIGTNG